MSQTARAAAPQSTVLLRETLGSIAVLGTQARPFDAAQRATLQDLATLALTALRSRQRVIVELLKNRRLLEQVRNMDREKWVKLLRASGFTDEDLGRWHRDFERTDPAYHQRFLGFLGLPADEISIVRAHSRQH